MTTIPTDPTARTLPGVMPVYHFHEVHSRLVDAPPAAVWEALTRLCLEDLSVTRPLVALRHLGSRAPAARTPLLTSGPVSMLELREPHYALGGTIARPWQTRPDRHQASSLQDFAEFDEPGWTKYLTDFHLQPVGAGTRLSTETRGYSTDDRSRRRFAAYWALIRLPSGVIRHDMLAAIDRLCASDVRR